MGWERHDNLLVPQPPSQVDFGGRKNRPSPDLRRKLRHGLHAFCPEARM